MIRPLLTYLAHVAGTTAAFLGFVSLQPGGAEALGARPGAVSDLVPVVGGVLLALLLPGWALARLFFGPGALGFVLAGAASGVTAALIFASATGSLRQMWPAVAGLLGPAALAGLAGGIVALGLSRLTARGGA